MSYLITIPTAGWMYQVMYLLAFSTGIVYILYQTKRNQWPVHSILGMLAFIVTGAVIGSKLVLIPFSEIIQSLQTLTIPEPNGKSFLGGVAGGLIAMIFAIRFLKLPFAVADHVAMIVPVSLMFGRVGCLFAGCCFGRVTNLPWGVQYQTGSVAHSAHVHHGFIDYTNTLSLSVHPVPLYEIIFCIIILGSVLTFKNYLKKPGIKLILIISLYGFLRFTGEFFRFQIDDSYLSNAQIATGITGFIAVILFITYLKKETRKHEMFLKRTTLSREIVLSGLVISGIVLLQSLYSPMEIAMLYAVFVTVATGLSLEFIFRWISDNSYLRPAVLSILPLVLLMTGFAQADSDSTSNKSSSFGINIFRGIYGAWDIEPGPLSTDGGCESYPEWDGVEQKQKYYGVNAFYESTKTDDSGNETTWGISGSGGSHISLATRSENRIIPYKREVIAMVHPYFRYDGRYFGVTTGFHFGSSPRLRLKPTDYSKDHYELTRMYFTPSLSLRFFKRDGLFYEVTYGNGDNGTFPFMRIKNNFGLGFYVNDNYGSIKFGVNEWGYFLEPNIPIRDGLILSGTAGIKGEWRNTGLPQNHFSLGLKYSPNW